MVRFAYKFSMVEDNDELRANHYAIKFDAYTINAKLEQDMSIELPGEALFLNPG